MRLAWLSRGPQAERFRDRALPFPRALVALVAGVLVSGGCDATRATGPAEGGTPETVGPPAMPSAQVSGTLLGRAMIPPGEGSNSASANIQLPAAGENMAVVRITGGVSVTLTAPESCQAGLAGSWGPGGAHGGPQFQVFFEVVLPNGETIVQAGGKVAGNDMETAIGTNHFPGGRITRVWRNDVNGACWIIGKTDPVPLYLIVGGTQVLTVTTLGPATVSADRRYVETRGDTVTFTAGGSGGSVSAAYWRFVAGDTLETPGASSGEWINPRCEGQTTCRWAPPVSGRMYVVGADIDRVHWSGTAAGPVVWVGRAAPPCVEQPAAAARMSVASAGAVSGDEDACREQEPKLKLECTGGVVGSDGSVTQETNRVTRGQEMRCVASADPSTPGVVTITGWSFEGKPREDGDATSATWEGVMVRGGRVRVEGKVGDQVAEPGEATITVLDRDWSNKGPFVDAGEAQPCNAAGMRELPAVPTYADELGYVQFFPNECPDAAPEDPATNVSGGPNYDLYYFADLTVKVYARYRLNRTAMSSGSAFARLQESESSSAGGRVSGLNWCSRSVIPGLLNLVLAHELKHIEVYEQAFRQRMGPVAQELERMVDADASALEVAHDRVYASINPVAEKESNDIHKNKHLGNPWVTVPSDMQGPCALKNARGQELLNRVEGA